MTRVARTVAAAFVTLAVGPLAGCAGETPTLQGAVDGIVGEVNQLLGAPSLPGAHLSTIAACHEAKGWAFRPDVENAFEQTREAVRGLGTADYGTWRETALVLQVLTEMCQEHPSALVRVECLDTLGRIGAWTAAAVPATERRTSEPEVVAAIKRLTQAASGASDDPETSAEVAGAVNTLAAFRFDEGRSIPVDGGIRSVARLLRSQLNTSRSVLRALTGMRIAAFEADPRVRDALDRAWVSTGAAAVRSALLHAAVADTEEIVRRAAARDLAVMRPDAGPEVLGVVVVEDGATAVRREAARALGAWPAERAVPFLLPALSDDMPEVRGAAQASLSSVSGQALGEDRNAWTRWWQARSDAAPAPDGAPR